MYSPSNSPSTVWREVKEEDSASQIYKGLAVVMSSMHMRFELAKKALEKEIISEAPFTTIGRYDHGRTLGFDYRSVQTLPNFTTDRDRSGFSRAMSKPQYTRLLDVLEAMVPGMLILMTPDLLRISLMNLRDALPAKSPMTHPPSMEAGARAAFAGGRAGGVGVARLWNEVVGGWHLASIRLER